MSRFSQKKKCVPFKKNVLMKIEQCIEFEDVYKLDFRPVAVSRTVRSSLLPIRRKKEKRETSLALSADKFFSFIAGQKKIKAGHRAFFKA